MRRPIPTSRGGFTLIELLVVMGIIALLVGILMPALSTVRRNARATACKAQLQQIGYAFQMYLNQNKSHYPRAPAMPSVNPNNYPPLNETLSRYVGDAQRVFQCPADEHIYPTEGISYFYYAELGERPLAKTLMWQVFHDVTRVPVAWDADNFHGTGLPYNWLFVDGHVEHFLSGSRPNQPGIHDPTGIGE